MFLHLIGNDPKFPHRIRQRFEAADPGNHYWIILKAHPKQACLAGSDFEYVSYPEDLSPIVGVRKDWEGVIINGMLARVAPYLKVLPKDCAIGYQIWGGEAYNAVLSKPDELLLPETAKVTLSLLDRIRFWASRAFGPLKKHQIQARKVAKVIDVATFALEEEPEYFILKGLLPQRVKALAVRGHLDSHWPINPKCQARNVMVGNSGDPSNNHIDCLRILRNSSSLGEADIILPMSYGGKVAYRDKVIEYGKTSFGKRFVPLTQFRDINSYNKIISSCKYMIMNHRRQQGAGNIVAALARGVTVYIRSETTLSRGLRRLGFVFHAFEEFEMSGRLEEISNCAKTLNAVRYYKEFGRDRAIELTKQLVNKLRALQQ